ncbi:MAG: family 43 glycosylhydrolase [Saprospiraceae bacterium]|nr:family 43 glycosylhydrolase [Saprospiraceae bacterium]
MKYYFIIAFGLIIISVQGQSDKRQTYCNPIDINYRYNFEQIPQQISYRSAADPVIINHKGEYYLFATISGGYWHSKDLKNWKYILPERWPFEDNCAPAAWSYGDTLLIFQSTFQQRPILYTTTPETGKLHFYNRWLPLIRDELGPWDPALFHDEDTDRWFMYFGSSNLYPLCGIELDYNRRLTYKSDVKRMIYLYPHIHGWERFGPNHTSNITPFIEGAWMTKNNGKYYLQYGAPGTEYNVYANGTYVGDDPMGPFEYAPNNPVSYKPGGFVNGAGHGNTFKDIHGNYWNTGTPWIAVNWNFERRIAMFPAGFDKDDLMYANTRFGDFPQYIPESKWNDRNELFTGWMLLSYKKPVTASTVRDTFDAKRITDENPRTFWVAQTNKAGETATIDLQKVYDVKALQIHYTDYKSNIYANDENVYIQMKCYASTDQKNWQVIFDNTDKKEDRPNAYIELPQAVKARYIKYENAYVPTPNLAISDIRVFGNGDGNAPSTPANLKVQRHEDPRDATITWDAVPNVVGYNILWGIAPDKLYQTYQIWGDAPTKLELRALSVGVDYYYAIEAFDENGVSKISNIVADK